MSASILLMPKIRTRHIRLSSTGAATRLTAGSLPLAAAKAGGLGTEHEVVFFLGAFFRLEHEV